MSDSTAELAPVPSTPAPESAPLEPRSDFPVHRFDRLRPFLVSIVSDTDLWMYVSSTGALTAGRCNEDGAIFPYETDDRLHRGAGTVGPVTILRIHRGDGSTLCWRPFSGPSGHGVRRNLYKSVASSRITFEEVDDALGLAFRYRWQACDAFGWVRSAELEATGRHAIKIELLDGLLNLLPANAELSTQRNGSCLIDAYTRCEREAGSDLAIYALEARIIDRAEPSESLQANVAWQVGLDHPQVLLCDDQVERFVRTGTVEPETLLTGRRGAYLAVSSFQLAPGGRRRWRVCLDARRSQCDVASLQALLRSGRPTEITQEIDEALAGADQRLRALVAGADGLQLTGDVRASLHHFSNVLFNGLRGGFFQSNYGAPSADFVAFVRDRNAPAGTRQAVLLAKLPASIDLPGLRQAADDSGDVDLARLAREYLPVAFARRHGDPSRPWNRFTLRVRNDDGSPALGYEGNWRDIFQNWEALAASFPECLENLVAKFVNASTVDGFNPYRLTRDGIEWEVPEENNPWSHIGYWGDHQIIYLLKLLEASVHAHGGRLAALLPRRLFSYANVPYRLRAYARLCADPRETIDFDREAHLAIEREVSEFGTDAKLLRDAGGRVPHVTLVEKLLVPALGKLSNLVPGAGIWMNTQRPEWNDANNALAGNGISMVTLCYLRRYLAFCESLLASSGREDFEISRSVAGWLEGLGEVFEGTPPTVASDDVGRRRMLDRLGAAFEAYRQQAYASFDAVPATVGARRITSLLRSALAHLDEAIRLNRRPDGLFHAYNLLHFRDGRVEIGRLEEMLEGQVAVLSSGCLQSVEAAELVEAMFAGRLWREDQQTFVLYPVRDLPGFLQRNVVDEAAAGNCEVARRVTGEAHSSILRRDAQGRLRFNESFRNEADLRAAMDGLGLGPDERRQLLDLYESTFHHHRFTGRSGSMHRYEGIGCVYWHMVAKLLLAVQECYWRAVEADDPPGVRIQLARLYYRVRAGLGFNKSAREYGAFPLDAYSHTPLHAGAQQPGMTGQVKEEILTRFGELGVRRREGRVRFDPRLLRRSELLASPQRWDVIDCTGQARTIHLSAGSLGFTLAGTPVVYRQTDGPTAVTLHHRDGRSERIGGEELDPAQTRRLYSRDGTLARIEVCVPVQLLLAL